MKKSMIQPTILALVLIAITGCRLETEDLNPQPLVTATPTPTPSWTPTTYPPSGWVSPTRDNPNAPYATTQCGWFDGATKGLGSRGWHAYAFVQNVYYSAQFFDNYGAYSRAKCFNEVVFTFEKGFYAQRVANAKKTACACRWFNGEIVDAKPVGLGERGWHLSYALEILTANSKSTEFFSAKEYGNGGSASEEACKRFLVESNFICP